MDKEHNLKNLKKTHLFYGNDLSAILERTCEISYANTKKVNLNSLEDIQEFLNQAPNLSLFAETETLHIYLSFKLLKHFEKYAAQFADLIGVISKYKAVIIIVLLERFDKIVKQQILESELVSRLQSFVLIEEFVKLRYWEWGKVKNKINQMGSKYGLTFTGNSLNLLTSCFQDNLDNLAQELQKIKTYILPSNVVNEQVVNELYLGSSNIDDLYDLLVCKQTNGVSNVISNLTKFHNPLYLIATLQSKLRRALIIKTCVEDNVPIQQISKLTASHPYRLEKDIKQLQYLSS